MDKVVIRQIKKKEIKRIEYGPFGLPLNRIIHYKDGSIRVEPIFLIQDLFIFISKKIRFIFHKAKGVYHRTKIKRYHKKHPRAWSIKARKNETAN